MKKSPLSQRLELKKVIITGLSARSLSHVVGGEEIGGVPPKKPAPATKAGFSCQSCDSNLDTCGGKPIQI